MAIISMATLSLVSQGCTRDLLRATAIMYVYYMNTF